ncbi:MAG: hypothetical protein ACE5GE_02340 [Phycisphaerae bacterium]
MRRGFWRLLKLLAMIPLMGVYSAASCQADALREVADDLDRQANRIDDRPPDLGDVLSDLVDEL